MRSRLDPLLSKLKRRPIIVASLDGRDPLMGSARKASRLGSDLIEIRIDTLSPKKRKNLPALLTSIKKVTALPILATVRAPREQEPRPGLFQLEEEERKNIFETVIPFADLIDVELSSEWICPSLVGLAHRLGKMVILSYHNFHSIPSEKEMNKFFQKFKKFSGDIFKVAAMPKSALEVGKLLSFSLALTQVNRIFIAMGDYGKISRIAGFSFGSCFTYGSIGRPTAPGQISVENLVKACRFFYPARTSGFLASRKDSSSSFLR